MTSLAETSFAQSIQCMGSGLFRMDAMMLMRYLKPAGQRQHLTDTTDQPLMPPGSHLSGYQQFDLELTNNRHARRSLRCSRSVVVCMGD